jgi:hypothetical protein
VKSPILTGINFNNNDLIEQLHQSNDIVEYAGESFVKNSGKTRLGSNGVLYEKTANGRVFNGNKSTVTTPLSEAGESIDEIAGPIGYALDFETIKNSSNKKSAVAGVVGSRIGGEVGILAGGEAGALLGVEGGPVGITIGFVFGLVFSYIGVELSKNAIK